MNLTENFRTTDRDEQERDPFNYYHKFTVTEENAGVQPNVVPYTLAISAGEARSCRQLPPLPITCPCQLDSVLWWAVVCCGVLMFAAHATVPQFFSIGRCPE